jgi:hypothetical protein
VTTNILYSPRSCSCFSSTKLGSRKEGPVNNFGMGCCSQVPYVIIKINYTSLMFINKTNVYVPCQLVLHHELNHPL